MYLCTVIEDFEQEVKETVRHLKNGGVILYPTDTIWGLGCDATNDEAVERIYKIKKRMENKSMLILLDDEGKLLKYVKEVPDQAWPLIEYSTRPLTIIYDNALNVSRSLIAEDGSIGIRVTKDSFCKEIIRRTGKPIVSTSANISNEKPPSFFSEITDSILQAVDYVVNLRHNDKTHGTPSIIMRLDVKGHIQFIRR